jgi:hypothetical protein
MECKKITGPPGAAGRIGIPVFAIRSFMETGTGIASGSPRKVKSENRAKQAKRI